MAAGSTIGTIYRITTWGESHGEAVGVVVDGCPAGLELSPEDIRKYLDRRKPGQSRYASGREEEDRVQILSGVFQGKTTGTPISLVIPNEDQREKDYEELKDVYRPGHGDYTYDVKYGFRDYRGGGRASGRETAARVAAGAIAAKILEQMGVRLFAYTRSIGLISIIPERFDKAERDRNRLYMPDVFAAEEAEAYLKKCMEAGNSIGGVVECIIEGLPAGVGDPVFDKLSALLGQAILSIGGVKGFEIGDGFRSTYSLGSENNDSFFLCEGCGQDGRPESGKIKKKTNHAGGTLGGISDGSEILFRAAFKPTPSISFPQDTVDSSGNYRRICIQGRHDPVIVPRAVVVVEAMAACVVLDRLLLNMSSRLDRVIEFYSE